MKIILTLEKAMRILCERGWSTPRPGLLFFKEKDPSLIVRKRGLTPGPLRTGQTTEMIVFSDYQGSFPRVKRPGPESDHSFPSSTEVQNEWSDTSTPSIRLHDNGKRKLYLYNYLEFVIVFFF